MDERRNDGISRRGLLGGGLAGVGLATLGLHRTARAAPLAPSSTPSMLVIIELRGGNDGLNTIVPVTLSQYAARRPRVALTSAECLSMGSGPYSTTKYKMNPNLPNMLNLWTSGSLAIVNKVGYPQANMSHFKSLDIWGQGVKEWNGIGVPRSGWVARYADLYAPDPFGAVYIGHGRPVALLGGSTRLFMATDLSRYAFISDPSYIKAHEHRLRIVRRVLARNGRSLPPGPLEATRLAHELAGQIGAAVAGYVPGATYPNETFAHCLRDIATLIQAGTGTRIFYTGFEGFDSHANQGKLAGTGFQPILLAKLDAGLAAFEQDLRAMGVWDRTVIAMVSEFGRRTYDNNSNGTDHGGGNCMLLTGGAIVGGIYGTHVTDADLSEEILPTEIDFRSIYKEILTQHLGATSLGTVFPEPEPNPVVLGLV